MILRSNCRANMLIILMTLLTLGCVTQGQFEEMEKSRDTLAQRASDLELENQVMQKQVAASTHEIEVLRLATERLALELKREVAEGQVQIDTMANGVKIGLSEQLLFASGSDRLGDKGRAVLARIARKLKGGNEIISVVGHTDSHMIGESLESQFPSNWELAGSRASLIVRQLSEQGINPKRLRVVSRGPFDPVTSNDTASGRSKNRRTEIILRSYPR
jgi:chemotaxis protein MotB